MPNHFYLKILYSLLLIRSLSDTGRSDALKFTTELPIEFDQAMKMKSKFIPWLQSQFEFQGPFFIFCGLCLHNQSTSNQWLQCCPLHVIFRQMSNWSFMGSWLFWTIIMTVQPIIIPVRISDQMEWQKQNGEEGNLWWTWANWCSITIQREHT